MSCGVPECEVCPDKESFYGKSITLMLTEQDNIMASIPNSSPITTATQLQMELNKSNYFTTPFVSTPPVKTEKYSIEVILKTGQTRFYDVNTNYMPYEIMDIGMLKIHTGNSSWSLINIEEIVEVNISKDLAVEELPEEGK